jgi:hypothetical protein
MWECLSCDLTDVTRVAGPHSRMHACAGLRGLTVPMVPAGTRGQNVTREREDYIGDEDVQYDGEGRPIMAVQTIRETGEDCTVFAPTAKSERA